jgi:hypothetical protein
MHSELIDIGSNHLSSGSLFTEPIETPLDFSRQATMAAKPARENAPSSRGSFLATQDEINTTRPNPSLPILYTSTTDRLFPLPDPPLPPTDGSPRPLYILPDNVFIPPRPVVCEKHFDRLPEDALFYRHMKRARAQPEFREPAMLKKYFCERHKGRCPTHTSACFTILVGRFRNQCRTESVALREIRRVIGLCWTCTTWYITFFYRIELFLIHCSKKCLRDKDSLQKHKCEPTTQHPFTIFSTPNVISTRPQSLE